MARNAASHRIDPQLAEPQFRAILEATPDALVIIAGDGTIVLVNGEAQRMFGYEREELLGQPVEMLVPPRARAGHLGLRSGYVASPRPRPMGSGLEISAVRKDGTEFPVEISLSPIAVDGDVLVASSVRDVSDRKRAATDLQRAKDDLTNMVVHDLKNPVTGILMMVQLALRRTEELSPAHRRHFEQIARTSQEMLRLILNLLEISKIEEGKMPVVPEPVSLAEIVGAVAREYGPIAQEMKKTIRVDVDASLPPALADATLLRRILTNLLVNGLRHSGGQEVRIAAVAEPERLVLRVCDRGRGIPLAEQAGIFEKFTSVRRSLTADAVSDTGLGLPFCKLAAERMGGTITLASDPDGETVFAVSLPLAPTAG